MTRGRNVHLNVLLLANRNLEQLEAICRTVDLTHAQYVALFVLCLSDDPDAGMPIGAVADGLLNRASDTTRLVDRLERAGSPNGSRTPPIAAACSCGRRRGRESSTR